MELGVARRVVREWFIYRDQLIGASTVCSRARDRERDRVGRDGNPIALSVDDLGQHECRVGAVCRDLEGLPVRAYEGRFYLEGNVIGCTGGHALALQSQAGAELKFLCVDESEEALELARE